jgi:hypothetical protein
MTAVFTRLGAQHVHPDVAMTDSVTRFFATARAATTRYQSLENAIADGFVRVGEDSPSMGEHWVNMRRLFSGSLTAERPSILMYVRVAAKPVIVGVAYSALVDAGTPFPDFPSRAAWHAHQGTIDEETLPLAHVQHTESMGGVTATGVGVLHLWIGAPNPAGDWAPDNWTLPFVRAGLRAPPAIDAASRAIALASGGAEYYARAITTAAKLDASASRRVLGVLSAAADTVARMRRGMGDTASPEQLAALRTLWATAWDKICETVGPGGCSKLVALAAVWR